jgi:eukaryotic-like serine/threonine-protein kinase
VLAPLGAGGMGEVYRARDAKLNRDVALKVLPDSFIHDASHAARFRREAQVLASLNHPHIGGIYGLEEANGITALVLELVEGPTLADRIARGPIPLDEALPIAKQIAQALEAAHEQGIVHRDLKPANIKVRGDGTVKVLDFGLAKASDPSAASPDLSQPPTLTRTALSHPGMILGTARYMSPEQAAGTHVDKRSDIWAFGVVLFEMLTGEQVFSGDTTSHVIAAVLRAEPDWTALPPDTSASIRRLLRRCLEKDRKRRLDSAAAVGLELDDAGTTSAAEAPPAPSPRRVAPIAIASLIIGMGGALIAALASWLLMRPAPPVAAPLTRFTITPSPALPWRPSPQAAARDFAVAPDGSFLVYRAGDQGQLVVRWFDRLEASPLAGVASAVMPFVSPDSRWIGYVEDDLTLKKVAVTGGAPVTLARLPVWPRGASWVDDSTIIIGTNSPMTGLLRVPAGGGEPEVLTTPDRTQGEQGHVLPSGLPGGGAVLFTIGADRPENAQIALLDLKTRQRTTVLRGGRDAQYAASGHLVYLAGHAMSAVRFDLSRRAVVGDPVRVIDGVAASPTSALNVAVTAAGTLVFVPGGTGNPTLRSLVWVDRQGHETPIGAPTRPYESARLSPDGTRVAVSIRDQENDIWIWDLARKTLTRLTFDADVDMNPVWTPDSRRVVFASSRTGVFNLYARDVNESTPDVRLTAGANTQLPSSVTHDGAFVIGQEVRLHTKSDLVRVALAPGRGAETTAAESVVETPFEEWNGEISPDGRFIAYLSNESGQSEVYVRPYQQASNARWQVSSGGGTEPVWTRGGRELIYRDDAQRLTAVPVETTGLAFRTGTPSTLVVSADRVSDAWRAYDVSPDGKRFLVMKKLPDSPRATVPPGFVVVQNWFEELKRLVPAK